MRPVPVPDSVFSEGSKVGAERQVFGPPEYDLAAEETAAVQPIEALVYESREIKEKSPDLPSRALVVFHTPEDDDVEKLAEGGFLVVTFLGHIVPYEIAVTPALPT